MPYVLISTMIRMENGPTLCGDEGSDPELMRKLGAVLQVEAGYTFKVYRSPHPPRVVLDKLEENGYQGQVLASFPGSSTHCNFTEKRKEWKRLLSASCFSLRSTLCALDNPLEGSGDQIRKIHCTEMPYVLITTEIRIDKGPTLCGDGDSDPELMGKLGAVLVAQGRFKLYRSPHPPRVVLNRLAEDGYRVVSQSGHGNGLLCSWTLYKE